MCETLSVNVCETLSVRDCECARQCVCERKRERVGVALAGESSKTAPK